MATSFLDVYVEKFKLTNISNTVKAHLDDLEKALDDMSRKSDNSAQFDEIVKQYTGDIFDLIERIKVHVTNWHDWSFQSVLDSMKFIFNIANEVSQITSGLYSKVTLGDRSKTAKINFGQNLVQFVWFAVNPLQDKFSWIPFKKLIERWAIRYLSKLGLQAAFDMWEAQTATVKPMAATQTGVVKCLKAL